MHIRTNNFKLYLLCPIFILLGSIITLGVIQIDNCDEAKYKESIRHYRTKNINNPSIVVCILSAPKNLERRNVLRETWLKDINRKDILHYFVIGSSGLSPDFLLHLSAEQSKYNDLLILPIEDSYSQLTRKVLQTFVWLDEQLYAGLNFSYVLKCDDDSFVRLDLLKDEINSLQKSIENNNFDDVDDSVQSINIQRNINDKILSVYWGYFKGNAHIKTKGKWKESSWILCDTYLPYAQGGGYILSKELVKYIAKNEKDFR